MDHQSGIERRDSVAWAAQLALLQWVSRVGDPARAALREYPALLASVDQHAAEVRDALADTHGTVSLVSLASYADGVNDVAAARGCDLTDLAGTVRWPRAPWPLVRLLAVCQVAELAGVLD